MLSPVDVDTTPLGFFNTIRNMLRQGGFTKSANLKGVEMWVRGYLKLVSAGNRLRQERKFMEKALVIIAKVFGHPCCDNPELPSVSFITPNDNQLTTTIQNLVVNGNPIRRSFRQSLLRIMDLLNNYLYDCCTEPLTFVFEDATPSQTLVVSVTDLVTWELIYQTTLISGVSATGTTTVPAKYFGPAAFVQICITTAAAGTYNLNNGDTAYLTTTVVGTTCSTLYLPLQTTTYTIIKE